MRDIRLAAACLLALAGVGGVVFAEGEAFEPTGRETLDRFYSRPERHVRVHVATAEKRHTVSKAFLGINLSYFNTTDDIWQKYRFEEKLRTAGIGALRYPGGEETSFFHWRHPGVNGYEDLWDPNERHGTAPGRGRFQATWVAPEEWATNERFMNFDEFMGTCLRIGAEPIVGLNLSSGKKHNRREDGIREALDWMRYCREKQYPVTYWFLDNEPWNAEAAYTFSHKEYIDEVLAYGSAIRKEFPEAKLIVNPTSSESYNWWEGLEQFVRATGSVIDFVDVHWYWAWGQGTFDLWRTQTPLETGNKWKRKEWVRPYGEDIRRIKETFARAGYPGIGLMSLEWNVAPSDHTQTFSQSLTAVIQAELLMEYLEADVRMCCLWPLLWRTSREVWSEQDFFPSIVTQDPPYAPTLSLDMFRLVAPVQGGTVVKSESSSPDCRVLAVQDATGATLLLAISKNALRRRVYVDFDGPAATKACAEMIGLKHQVVLPVEVEIRNERQIFFYAEPYSLTAVRIE